MSRFVHVCEEGLLLGFKSCPDIPPILQNGVCAATKAAFSLALAVTAAES
jgi:hypothetical protein